MPKGKGTGKKGTDITVPKPTIGPGPHTGNQTPTPGSGTKIMPPAM